MSVIEQIRTHEMIEEIAMENLEELLDWLRQKKTMFN